MLNDKQKIDLVNSLGMGWHNFFPIKNIAKAMGLVSTSALSKRLKISIQLVRFHIASGKIPAPAVQLGQHWFYSSTDAELIQFNWENGSYKPELWEREVVAEMRALYKSGNTQSEIAQKFGVTQSTISNLIRGRKFSRKD